MTIVWRLSKRVPRLWHKHHPQILLLSQSLRRDVVSIVSYYDDADVYIYIQVWKTISQLRRWPIAIFTPRVNECIYLITSGSRWYVECPQYANDDEWPAPIAGDADSVWYLTSLKEFTAWYGRSRWCWYDENNYIYLGSLTRSAGWHTKSMQVFSHWKSIQIR